MGDRRVAGGNPERRPGGKEELTRGTLPGPGRPGFALNPWVGSGRPNVHQLLESRDGKTKVLGDRTPDPLLHYPDGDGGCVEDRLAPRVDHVSG